jgi:hypothetical protein
MPMRALILFPLMIFLVILQSAVVSRINLLAGHADILLVFLALWGLQERADVWPWAIAAGLLVGFISGLPWLVVLAGYLLVAALTWLLRRRIWEAPLLGVFAVTFIGTLSMHSITFVVLKLSGNPQGFTETLELITLPSLLLNLLLTLPLYAFVRDLAGWVHPAKETL